MCYLSSAGVCHNRIAVQFMGSYLKIHLNHINALLELIQMDFCDINYEGCICFVLHNLNEPGQCGKMDLFIYLYKCILMENFMLVRLMRTCRGGKIN